MRAGASVGSGSATRPLRRALGALLASAVLFGALASAASAAECTDTWTGPAEGIWSTPGSWSAKHAPGATDTACLGAGTTVTVAEAAQVAAVRSEGTIVVSGGPFEVLSTTQQSELATLKMTGGVLQVSGTLTVSASFLWTAAALAGTGRTVILPGAEGTIAPSASFAYIYSDHLVNQGTLSLPSGWLKIANGGELLNEGTFDLGSEHAPAIAAGEGGSKIANLGTFQKASGTGESAIGVFVENKGTVKAQQGKLALDGGGSSSGSNRWEAASGAEVVFQGNTYTLREGALAGQIALKYGSPLTVVNAEGVNGEAARVEVDVGGGESPGGLEVQSGTMTVESLTMKTGTQDGAGTLKVAKSLDWLGGGAFSGAGQTIVLPGAEATVSAGVSYALLYQRLLVNRGTFSLPGSNFIQLRGGAEILNEGTFTVDSEHAPAIQIGTGAKPRIVNAGTFQKTAGSGESVVEPAFENSKTVRATSGHLVFSNPIALAGSEHVGHECYVADPVDCATGDLAEAQTDLQIGGRGIGLVLTRTYSAQAAAAGTLGPFGYGWASSYGEHLSSEEEGKKVTLTEARGGTVPFTQSGSSWLAPAWSQDILSGNPTGGYVLTLPDQTKYGFSGAGRLQAITDRNGNETTLSYDEAGHLKTVTDPAGRQLTLAYNAEGLVETATDPMGHVVHYAYEGKTLKSVTLPGEASPNWQFKYDASRRITQITDARGGKTTDEYDSSSRVVSQTDPAGRTTTFKYEPFHTQVTNKATGAVTEEWFTSDHEPFSITRGYGTVAATTRTFGYDEAGHLTSATDGDGHTTTYGYDAEGNRTSEKDALGHETKWAYDSAHEVTSETTPRGETTTIKRDARGNVESISRPAPGEVTQTTSFKYGEHGELQSATDPLERTWSFGYDAYGDRTSETDPLGEERTYGYDKDSRLVSVVSPRGNLEGVEAAEYETTIERDPQGRPLKVTDPLGHTTEYSYDANGNLASTTDAKAHTTKYTYDADDERTKVEKPDGAILETAYDGAGQVTSQTDANKHSTTYVRNALEQPVEIIDPLGRKTLQEFDPAGNLIKRIDAAERTTTYSYDAAGRLTAVDYSEEATPDVTLEYDADGNVIAISDGTGKSTSPTTSSAASPKARTATAKRSNTATTSATSRLGSPTPTARKSRAPTTKPAAWKASATGSAAPPASPMTPTRISPESPSRAQAAIPTNTATTAPRGSAKPSSSREPKPSPRSPTPATPSARSKRKPARGCPVPKERATATTKPIASSKPAPKASNTTPPTTSPKASARPIPTTPPASSKPAPVSPTATTKRASARKPRRAAARRPATATTRRATSSRSPGPKKAKSRRPPRQWPTTAPACSPRRPAASRPATSPGMPAPRCRCS